MLFKMGDCVYFKMIDWIQTKDTFVEMRHLESEKTEFEVLAT